MIRFAREGLPEVRKQQLALLAILTDLRTALQPVLPGASIVVNVPAEVMFSGDPELLQRALENLIRNAAEGGATQITLTY